MRVHTDLHLKVHLETPPADAEVNATPKFASSSPGIEPMDVSPLPHKPPFFQAQVTLPSPTPDETPSEPVLLPDLLSPIEAIPQTFLQLPEYVKPLYIMALPY